MPSRREIVEKGEAALAWLAERKAVLLRLARDGDDVGRAHSWGDAWGVPNCLDCGASRSDALDCPGFVPTRGLAKSLRGRRTMQAVADYALGKRT